jgi:hypothetical protein
MTNSNHLVNRVAPISNLNMVAVGADRLQTRVEGLPGIAVLFGPPGYGKTFACAAIANQLRGYYIQMRSAWSRKTLLEKILFEMGIKPAGTIPVLLDQVCEQLAKSRRPLFIDEFDQALRSDSMVELVRDIYEGAQASLMLVGEEGLPNKLRKWERFHSRVMTWLPALPVSLHDAQQLAPIYCPDVVVSDDLLQHLVEKAHGSVRRVSVNLTRVKEQADLKGESVMSMKNWNDAEHLYTGEAPARRAA